MPHRIPVRQWLAVWMALAPALLLAVLPFVASLVYDLVQSLGFISFLDETPHLTLAAYQNLVFSEGASIEFWPALGFSLWISSAATLVSMALALAIVVWLMGNRGAPHTTRRAVTLSLNLNLAFPHLVWAIGLLLLFSQSGWLARLAATAGWLQSPADFPILVRDRIGFGIILHYIGKEAPFLVLILLAVMRSQVEAYDLVAQNLGATMWQRLRYITFPLVKRGLWGGGLLIFAYVFGAYEVPAILGVRYPRTLATLALDFFANPDLRSRAEGMAISVLMAVTLILVAIMTHRLEHHAQS